MSRARSLISAAVLAGAALLWVGSSDHDGSTANWKICNDGRDPFHLNGGAKMEVGDCTEWASFEGKDEVESGSRSYTITRDDIDLGTIHIELLADEYSKHILHVEEPEYFHLQLRMETTEGDANLSATLTSDL